MNSDIDDLRRQLEDATERNAKAEAEGLIPPIGRGAVEVLRRRLEAATGADVPEVRDSRAISPHPPTPRVGTAPTRPPAPPIMDRGDVADDVTFGDATRSRLVALELSDREVEVLALLCGGRSNKAIAEGLFIGEETVKSHLSTIYRKLGVPNRFIAVATVLRWAIEDV